MISNILTVAEQVLILFILIGVGFCTARFKIFNKSSIKRLTDFMLYIVTPAVIINSFNRKLDMDMLKGLCVVFVAAIGIHLINILISRIFIHDKSEAREKVLRMSVIFSNCGYMSFPLQEAIFGSDGVFYGAAFVAVFNIVLWTYGEQTMKGGGISIKKAILNPGIIGTVIGLVIFFASVPLPNVISSPISSLAALNTPVAMVIVGFHLASAKLNVKGANVWLTLAVRHIVSPLILVFAMIALGFRSEPTVVCAVAASAPIAAAVTMFSNKYNADTPLAASMTSISTLLSIVTMPVIVGAAQYFCA
ncbi:MAG: AEC family transporter [Firmicutes bacterium]|nr:AEC family transporter [Bacillota bacterium]